MSALLTFIICIFLAIIIVIAVAALSFYRQLRNAARRFRPKDTENRTKVGGNVVIDKRTEEARNKKIIPDDEGEYVDYE